MFANSRILSDSFYKRHMEEMGKAVNASWKAWIQPLTDIHYNSDFSGELPTGNKHYLYGFMAVAVFILLVACINYMNLATARATKRVKEVGIRKILGSGKDTSDHPSSWARLFYSPWLPWYSAIFWWNWP